MPTPYRLSSTASFALHAPDWHVGCRVSFHVVAGRPMLYCEDCRCLASMEAVAAKVDLLDSSSAPPPAPDPATP